MSTKKYKIKDYLSFLKNRIGFELDENNLEWNRQGHSLLVIDMTNERTYIIYDPVILGHWEFEEGDDYQIVVENHFKHIIRLEQYPNVIPFKPPKIRKAK